MKPVTVFLLLALFSGGTLAQDMSPHLEAFLYYVQQNYFTEMMEEEYNALNPGDWAWVLGKAFDTEFERTLTNAEDEFRKYKLAYLERIWEELTDYMTDVGPAYDHPSYTASAMRAYLRLGFYGFDQFSSTTNYYTKLGMDSPKLSHPMTFYDELPAGGTKEVPEEIPEGYIRPWTISLEDLVGVESFEEGIYLEPPSEIYIRQFHSPSGIGLIGTVTSDASTEPGTNSDTPIESADTRDDSTAAETEFGPLSGTWRTAAGEATIEFIFAGGPETGNYTMRILKDGNQINSISGTYEGQPDDTGAYVNYTLTDKERVSTLIIREKTENQLQISAWGTDLTLQRVE